MESTHFIEHYPQIDIYPRQFIVVTLLIRIIILFFKYEGFLGVGGGLRYIDLHTIHLYVKFTF